MLPKLQYKKGDEMLLGDVAEVRTGLVLSRKKAQSDAEVKLKYNALNLYLYSFDYFLFLLKH